MRFSRVIHRNSHEPLESVAEIDPLPSAVTGSFEESKIGLRYPGLRRRHVLGVLRPPLDSQQPCSRDFRRNSIVRPPTGPDS